MAREGWVSDYTDEEAERIARECAARGCTCSLQQIELVGCDCQPLVFASADTLEAMRLQVSEFYGNSKTLVPTGENSWRVIDTYLGKEAGNARVVRKRGRFHFEFAA